MSKLEEAAQRLHNAVDRLEAAATKRVTNGATELRADLDAARQENVELQAVTDAVSKRLSTAVTRLKAVLDNHDG